MSSPNHDPNLYNVQLDASRVHGQEMSQWRTSRIKLSSAFRHLTQ